MAHFFYKFQKGIYNGMLITSAKGSTYELVFESYGKGDHVDMSLKNIFTETSAEVKEEVLLEKLASGEIWPQDHAWMPSAKWLKSEGVGVEIEMEEELEEVEG